MTGRIRRSISSSINAAERIVSWAFCAKALTERSRDLLLHPVRLRIVQALVKQPMTASGLKEVLGDVAQATLYRHIKALENGGMLDIVAERQVRGTVERTCRVVESAVALSARTWPTTPPTSRPTQSTSQQIGSATDRYPSG
jgi:DNA-binding transcriptional ArsR family regulator